MIDRIKKFLLIVGIAACVIGIASLKNEIKKSPIFLIRDISISGLQADLPVTAEGLKTLMRVELEKVNLFDLNLQVIEKRLLTHPWVYGVTVSKRFPSTVSVNVEIRRPLATVQNKSGELRYLDQFGELSIPAEYTQLRDLPIVSLVGEPTADSKAANHNQQILALIKLWNQSPLAKNAELASLDYRPENGYRLVISYRLEANSQTKARTFVDIGQNIDTETLHIFNRLNQVVSYLSAHSILARQVWADLGKKVVVKIARSS